MHKTIHAHSCLIISISQCTSSSFVFKPHPEQDIPRGLSTGKGELIPATRCFSVPFAKLLESPAGGALLHHPTHGFPVACLPIASL